MFDIARLGLPTLPQHLLHALYGISLLVQQVVDSAHERDVRGAVVTPIARPLHRLQLRKARFPIAQDMLGDAELLRQFTNRQ